MTTHSGDTPTVTQFSNISTQWRSFVHATVAVSRFRRTHQQGLGGLEHLQSEFHTQNGPWREHGDTHSQASHNEEANQAAQLDPKALDRKLGDKNPEVEVLKLIRDNLEQQLDAYGVYLVLLAGITFLAILQPPGSFDNGKLQESLLVSLFMLLATLSFFIACTGLGAVVAGRAELFRPFFFPHVRSYAVAGLAVDSIQVLADICLGNVYRVMRIRIYVGVALVLCIAAYICGAFAVMVTNGSQRYMLIGAMGAGGVIMLLRYASPCQQP